jgi:hypothetical protein
MKNNIKKFILLIICIICNINPESKNTQNQSGIIAQNIDYCFDKGAEYTEKGIQIVQKTVAKVTEKTTSLMSTVIQSTKEFLGYDDESETNKNERQDKNENK